MSDLLLELYSEEIPPTLQEDAKNNIGDSQGMIISYSRGFKNGLTAISTHSILKRF